MKSPELAQCPTEYGKDRSEPNVRDGVSCGNIGFSAKLLSDNRNLGISRLALGSILVSQILRAC